MRYFTMVRRFGSRLSGRSLAPALGVGLLALGPLAHADGVDFTSLTGAVLLTTVTTAILAVAAAKAVPAIASYGAKIILGFIKR